MSAHARTTQAAHTSRASYARKTLTDKSVQAARPKSRPYKVGLHLEGLGCEEGRLEIRAGRADDGPAQDQAAGRGAAGAVPPMIRFTCRVGARLDAGANGLRGPTCPTEPWTCT